MFKILIIIWPLINKKLLIEFKVLSFLMSEIKILNSIIIFTKNDFIFYLIKL